MSKSINYSNYGQQGDRVRKAQEPNNTSAFCNVLFHGTMAAFFYVYAFRNPDYDYCWASTIGDVRFAFEIEDAFLETTNVSETFRLWFALGFSISAFSLLYSLLAGFYVVKKQADWSLTIARVANVLFFI